MFKKIDKDYLYNFNIKDDGLYIVEIEASCQSGKMFGLFGGQDLRVEIDNRKFGEKSRLKNPEFFNIPVSWNGTELQGKAKSIFFILHLDKGEHTIEFISKRGSVIESEPLVRKFSSQTDVIKDRQAKDGDRYPWVTVALINLPLSILETAVKCEKRKSDSDDVKLIINGRIEKNTQSNWWAKNWYFQGRFMLGNTRESRFYLNLKKGVHFIEFWADRMPVLKSVKIYIDEDNERLKVGINKKTIKLWSISFLLIMALSYFTYYSQGRVYFKNLDFGEEYIWLGRARLEIGVLDGFRVKKAIIGPINDQELGSYGIIRDSVSVDYYDLDNDGLDDVLVSARHAMGSDVMYFFRIGRKGLEPIEIINNHNAQLVDDNSIFAENINFGRKDELGRYTFVTKGIVNYSNGDTSIFREYYKFNNNAKVEFDRSDIEINLAIDDL